MKKIFIKRMSTSVYCLKNKHEEIGRWYITHSKSFMKDRAIANRIKENYFFIQLMEHLK